VTLAAISPQRDFSSGGESMLVFTMALIDAIRVPNLVSIWPRKLGTPQNEQRVRLPASVRTKSGLDSSG
jgi:hypothetical protein